MVDENIITHHFYGSNIKKYTKTRKLVISLNVKENKNMKIYNGSCQDCKHLWEMIGRVPNYCPECGKILFKNKEELITAQKRMHIHDCRNSYDAQHPDLVKYHDMGT